MATKTGVPVLLKAAPTKHVHGGSAPSTVRVFAPALLQGARPTQTHEESAKFTAVTDSALLQGVRPTHKHEDTASNTVIVLLTLVYHGERNTAFFHGA